MLLMEKIKRPNHAEHLVRLKIQRLPEGVFLATSPDLPGLVAQGGSIAETMEIARDVARKLVESYLEHGDPLPFRRRTIRRRLDAVVPVTIAS